MPLTGPEAQVIDTGIRVSADAGTQYANRKYEREQRKADQDREDYWNYQARKWAVEDWERSAAYNSPEQQMKRFKEAGLNPNLIYGKASEMPMVRNTSVQSSRSSVGKIENPLRNENVATAYYSALMMEKQIKLLDQEAMLKRLEVESKAIDNKQKANDYMAGVLPDKQDYDWQSTSIRSAAIRAKYQSDISEAQKDQIELSMASELRQTKTDQEYQKLLQLKKQNARSDKEIEYLNKKLELLNDQRIMNQFEIKLNKRGFTKTDEVYYRVLNGLIDDFMTMDEASK